ncbi:conserved hypothetical protein [Theileria equi strain WA]|uniref:Uncharacterized protein n=1 Tax=Theileria equi strain WA TaxID=1537102 RepID=L1LFC8_THEEQ|nr:conserved hypothetical protein [Theileria equi strain WA]EKX73955.1 conserved hypothetical protein [Theileria equi strain WA]|eukprot:XP_004833407.1 conserved hypothetical protein [Theileria equi strain WA]
MYFFLIGRLISRNIAGFGKNRRGFSSSIDVGKDNNGSGVVKGPDSDPNGVMGPPSNSTGQLDDSDYVFSFDPMLKSKVIQISGDCQGSDFSRKIQTARDFIKSGHRVEVVIYTKQGKTTKTQTDKVIEAIHSALPRQIDIVYSHLSDIAKPFTIKSRSRGHARQFIIKFWPI